jgi:hypothetical protein
MSVIKIFFLACLVLTHSQFVGAQTWLPKILPLRTTVADIQPVLRAIPEISPEHYFFKLKEGNLILYYSRGNCIPGAYGGWDVPEGTITHFTFYPRRKRELAYYKVDPAKMKQSYDSGQRVYSDENSGLAFWIQFGRVVDIRKFPSSNDERLRCKNPKARSDSDKIRQEFRPIG